MDEDPFGASVWATDIPSTPSTSRLPPKIVDEPFTPSPRRQTHFAGDPFSFNDDDFDSSEPIVASTSPFQPDFSLGGAFADVDVDGAPADDDDFGDFGEFGDAEDGVGAGFDSYHAEDDDPSSYLPPNDFTNWEPLSLNPFPDIEDLSEAITALTRPLWGDWTTFTMDPIRETEGVSKILTTTER
jgi:hypothetical protein